MSKGSSYNYSGTKGHIVEIAHNLPQTGDGLLSEGWEETSHPAEIASGHHVYKEPSTGLTIRYDEPIPGANGFAGKDHFHIVNPNGTGTKDKYLDANGNPVARGSKASHILPKGDK